MGSAISSTMTLAMGATSSGTRPGTRAAHSRSPLRVRREAWPRSMPPMRVERTRSPRRVPSQAGHVRVMRYLPTRARAFSSLALASAFSTVATALK